VEVTNTSKIPYFFIEEVGIGSINYTNDLDLSSGADVNAVAEIIYGNVTIQSSVDNRFNSSAVIIMTDLHYLTTPRIYRNGKNCQSSICTLISYKPLSGTLTFNVTEFSSYTTDNNANLSVWDASDPEGGSTTKYVDNDVMFYTNYTDSLTGKIINGTNVNCKIKFNESGVWSLQEDMNFNDTTMIYEYNRSFSFNDTIAWNVDCSGLLAGYEPLNVTDDILILPIPDLIISSLNFLNTSEMFEGELANISLNITNLGSLEALNFFTEIEVSLWNGTKTLNETLLSDKINLSAGSSAIINFTWIGKIGNYIFDGTVDSTNIVIEMNDSNNFFSKNTSVSSWHIFYGDYGYALFISNAVNETLMNWSASSPEASLFYSDVDSTFYPFDLDALSGVGDLADADNALGLSGFADGIVSLFDADNNGIADRTMTLEIAGVDIANIPIINSTNTSSFLTGILWDTNDGASYDGNQDLVFVTVLNMSKVGYYGTYDFEIRVPATLDTLFGVTNVVEKTMEVK